MSLRGEWGRLSWRGGLILFTLSLTVATVIAFLRDWRRYRENTTAVEHTYQLLATSEQLLSAMKDAETGQRGFLLTGDESYLAPYNSAINRIPVLESEVRRHASNNAIQRSTLEALGSHIHSKLAELAETVRLRREIGPEAALAVVETHRGESDMQEIRRLVDLLQSEDHRLLSHHSARLESQANQTRWLVTGSGLMLFLLLALAAVAIERDTKRRVEDEAKIRALNEVLEQRVQERTAALAAANDQLEYTNKELEAFAYSVSHDLRAPLRSIDSFSQIILEDYESKLDEEGVGFLRRIRANAQRMGQLISDLLNLSRLARAEIHRESVAISSLAMAIIQEWRSRQPERAVEVKIEPGLHARCDPRLIRIVLDNLLGNAWKFTSKTPQALIEFGLESSSADRVYYVRDNGAGFDMAYANMLFSPFQRLHQAHEFEGTGIGLATVQRVIVRHGGRIWAESSVGQGSIFYFTLNEAAVSKESAA